MAKTICPITRADFEKHAQALSVKINGVEFTVDPREFSTGSLGWYLNGKTSVEINGKKVSVTIGLNMAIVGSKELPKEP